MKRRILAGLLALCLSFGMVVPAFAQGNSATVEPPLSDSTFASAEDGAASMLPTEPPKQEEAASSAPTSSEPQPGADASEPQPDDDASEPPLVGADASEPQPSVGSSVPLAQDLSAPVIRGIDVNGLQVTVRAEDETAMHAQAYSFNGGWTWQAENTYRADSAYTWVPGTIVVRDAAGNIEYNRTNVSVEPIVDVVPPKIEIAVNGSTVTVRATDDVALAAEAYSFNGGWTWQKEPTFTTTTAYTWVAGTIVVRDAAGNVEYNRKPISAGPVKDNTPPTIHFRVQGLQVILTAQDDVALHDTAYSFNGGWTWQRENTFTASSNYTWVPGTICVRDAAGNINYNRANVTVQTIQDTTPPTMQIETSGKTVTVKATDAVGLHEQAYSFNGGWTWQRQNTFTASTDYTWVPGTICVRDAAGNINYNRVNVTVQTIQDKTPPTMRVEVNGKTVTIKATDAGGLHEQAYSFNGGWTWQANNVLTVQEAGRTWPAGTICVRDRAGNMSYNTTEVKVGDFSAPVITAITATPKGTAKSKVVTVSATDNVALHAEAYSFNGGWSWQKENTLTVTKDTTFGVSAIQVRDAAGNISYNKEAFTVNMTVPDLTKPVITSISVTPEKPAMKKTVTVVATDDQKLHEEAYSFDGGWSWQKSNTFQVTETSKTWVPGTIQVRDAAGNISYNVENVEVVLSPDQIKPVIGKIEISPAERYTVGKSVVVTASDDQSGLAAEAYSFNGGWTWQASNRFDSDTVRTWTAGTICVRDAEGNISYNTSEVYLGKIIKVTNNMNSATVTLEEPRDNGWGYPAVSFSFDGGTSWQASNSYTTNQSREWPVGTILAKDAAGHVNYNGEIVSVKLTNKTIDVSAHQGYIDWKKVKASGVDYAILRAITWSGGQNGGYSEDAFFDYNMKQAKAAGIKVGAYIYTYAFNYAEVDSEVAAFQKVANRLKSEGYTFDLPVFVDHEYNRILDAVPNYNDRTNLLRYEMALLSQSGYYPGMYMSTSWAQKNVNAAQLQREGYDLWIADYRGYNGWGDSVVMWQYTSKGSVPGISGGVDMNYLYKDYTGIIDGSTNGTPPSEVKLTVFDEASGKTVTDSRLNILAAIVSNEVGGTRLTGGDRAKLFKAQAIAAHSWLLYQYEHTNTQPRVKLNYGGNFNAAKTAVAQVEKSILTYQGTAANTVYSSCTGGVTNSAYNYWGSNVPYLVSVSSPHDLTEAAQYQNKVMTQNEAEIRASLAKLLGGSFSTTLPKEQWIKVTAQDANGYVTGVQVCGKNVKVSDFYEKVNGFYSPNFTVTYSNGIWTFKSKGFGHCVGMSQYGAMGMIALDGKDYIDVLGHYYPGVTLTMTN